jgi:drug/metabolite transporter (DMT)-like permease
MLEYVDRRASVGLLVLAALWGSSYLFIKLGLEDLSPAVVVFVRLALAALVLVPVSLARGALTGVVDAWAIVTLLALVQVAAPFLLITAGELEISSSLAGILVASAPIWTAILALRLDPEEQSRGWRLVGVVVGMVGVGVLLGLDIGGDAGGLLGGLAVVLASVGYAVGGFMIKRRLAHLQPVGLVTATMVASALMTLPLALLTAPEALPGATATLAMAALGVGGTGIAFVIYYTLIATVGPARASLVAYIAPVFAVVYGVLLLDERFTFGTLAGIALILGGSWLAAGATVPGRAPAPAATVAGPG